MEDGCWVPPPAGKGQARCRCRLQPQGCLGRSDGPAKRHVFSRALSQVPCPKPSAAVPRVDPPQPGARSGAGTQVGQQRAYTLRKLAHPPDPALCPTTAPPPGGRCSARHVLVALQLLLGQLGRGLGSLLALAGQVHTEEVERPRWR